MANRLDADRVAAPVVSSHRPHGHAYYENLRRRLRWQLLFVYVAPLLVLSISLLLQYSAVLRQGIDSHLRAVAENQRNTVDLYLEERVANLRSAFLTDFGRLPPSTPDISRVLAGLRRESPTFVDVGLFDPQGKLVAYAGPYPELLGKDYLGEQWYRRLLEQERGYYISDVYLGFRGSPHFIIAARRLIDGQLWVLRASVDPEKFAAFVGSAHLMHAATATIINTEGQPQTLSGSVPLTTSVTSPPPRSPETVVRDAREDHHDFLSAYAWLQETDWALVVRVPEEIAYAPLRQARLTVLGIMLGALLLIVAFVLRGTRRLVGRLEAADAAQSDLQRQLFNAAKLASVGEMSAGVAHEINNPLAIIYEEVGIMKDTLNPEFGLSLDPDDFRERLQTVADAAMRGRAVTSKLLAFARRHDPDPRPEDLNRICERVLAMKNVEFNVSNITVVREFGADLPPAMVNENQIEQVLLNLLNNAKDAIKSAGVITVRTRRQGANVVIEVADTGCGMTAEQMENIFFPFYTTKGVGKGTGLGLSISYGIVKAYGGRIEVQSEVGSGSTFTILLPAISEEALKGAPRARAEVKDERETPYSGA